MTLKDWIPPVLFKLRQKARAETPAYRTYEDAAVQCAPGYDAEELATVVVEKTRIYRDSLQSKPVVITDHRTASIATAIGLSVSGSSLNCLDFGGAAGAHFFLAQSFLGKSLELRWHVVETKNMVSAAAKISGDGLRFFTSINEAVAAFQAVGKEIDLVFTSGALQYMPKPEETLTQLVNLGARRFFLTRVGLSDQRLEQRVTVQHSRLAANGPGPLPPGFKDRAIAYPVTFCSKDDVERILANHYAIDLRFSEEPDAYSIGNTSIAMFGFSGKRKGGPNQTSESTAPSGRGSA